MSRSDRTNLMPYRTALVLAPVLMGVAMLTDLSPRADSTEELLALVAEHPDTWVLAGSLFLLSGLAWLVAGIGLSRLLDSRSRLIAVGGIALAAGGVTLALVDAAGMYLPGLAGSGTSVDHQVSVVEHVESAAPLLAIEIVHVAGWGIGLLLVAVGLLRSRALPRWVPVLLLVSLAGMVAFAAGPPLIAAVVVQVAATAGIAIHSPRTTDRVADPVTVAAVP